MDLSRPGAGRAGSSTSRPGTRPRTPRPPVDPPAGWSAPSVLLDLTSHCPSQALFRQSGIDPIVRTPRPDRAGEAVRTAIGLQVCGAPSQRGCPTISPCMRGAPCLDPGSVVQRSAPGPQALRGEGNNRAPCETSSTRPDDPVGDSRRILHPSRTRCACRSGYRIRTATWTTTPPLQSLRLRRCTQSRRYLLLPPAVSVPRKEAPRPQ